MFGRMCIFEYITPTSHNITTGVVEHVGRVKEARRSKGRTILTHFGYVHTNSLEHGARIVGHSRLVDYTNLPTATRPELNSRASASSLCHASLRTMPRPIVREFNNLIGQCRFYL